MIDFESAPEPGSGSPFQPPRPPKDPTALLNALNEKQREAVQLTEGPLIVLAGAGSGKTKMLTSRIAYLIDVRGVSPFQILAVTFTNKAAAEMRERVLRLLGETSALGTPEIGTFHSVCVRLLRREMAHTPFKQPFVIYDDSDQLSLVKSVVQKLGIDDKAFSPKAMQAAINRAKCDAIEPQDLDPTGHEIFERQFKRVYTQYQQELFSNNAVDFGEIICMAYRLLRDNPGVRERYHRRFKYLHVDEYQDTNRAQYLLLSQLASRRFGGHENICVVGDEDQSIYKWRGADIRNILDFESDYPGARVVKLEQNYRSTKTIIEAAGHVIKNNTERKDKTLWTDNDQGLPIIRMQLPDDRVEAEAIIGEIKRLCQHEERTYNDFAIFYRTHAQSRSFEDIFRREKIPYQIVGGLRFYDRKEIKDVLCYFRAILNPTDSVSLKRIINIPARGIGKTTLEKLEELYNRIQEEGPPEAALQFAGTAGLDTSYWGALQTAAVDSSQTSAGTARKLLGFVQLMTKLMQERPKLLVSELYHLILDETGYVRELRQEGTDEALARIENLEEFDNLLKEFEDDFFEALPGDLSETQRLEKRQELLALFLEQSTLASDADLQARGMPAGGSIQMMTLHSSKGLEFPVVFLPGMEEGLFPSVRAWEDETDSEIEEERRLCYVGMTRAREHLYMTSVAVRRIWGEIQYQEPARFFEEIPSEYIELRDLTRSRQPQGAPRQSFSRPSRSERFGGDWGSGSESNEQVDHFHDEVAQAAPRGSHVGLTMIHPEYGPGRIIASDGLGDDQRLTIEFRNQVRRKFLLRFVHSFIQEE